MLNYTYISYLIENKLNVDFYKYATLYYFFLFFYNINYTYIDNNNFSNILLKTQF